jgi:L,D-transpeptidase YbiS
MLSLHISIFRQQLTVQQDGQTMASYAISTAANGAGQLSGSACTPTGLHVVRSKIGAACPMNTVFIGRRPTGEIYTPELAQKHPQRDWILTRILWLSGREPGHNRGGDCDSLRRFIYIHGTPDTEPMGLAKSHGCIRMRNAEVVQLFDLVDVGCMVHIMV